MFSILDKTPIVKNIILINIVIFLLMNFSSLGRFYESTALYYFDHPNFEIWQLITHMFQHSLLQGNFGFWHIFFNMFVLFQFGTILEMHWGSKRFLMFYLCSGLAAAFLFTLNISSIAIYAFDTFFPYSNIEGFPYELGSAVGASGAISGIIAAFAYLHPNTKMMLMFIPISFKAKHLIPFAFLVDFVLGVWGTLSTVKIIEGQLAFITGIAHFAHLGGALAGFLIVIIWQRNRTTFY